MARLVQHNYGKSRVRLAKITRHPDRHDFTELTVDTALEGDFETAHLEGDNSKVIPTDTQKNTVHALALDHALEDIESFGIALGRHFVDSFPAIVTTARITLNQRLWKRIVLGGQPHHHAFEGAGTERRLAEVIATPGDAHIRAGIRDLHVLKTTNSAFKGYPRDRYTTLPETDDRIFATAVNAWWSYRAAPKSFNAAYSAIRAALVETFAEHMSLSVQQTLFEMGRAALDACAEMEEIRISLPNSHYLPLNFQPFGLANPNVIFLPTDEPHGLIEATIVR